MAEEENRLNPSTGISGFIKEKKKENVLSETLKNIDAERKAELDKREKQLDKRESKPIIITKIKKQPSQLKGIIGGYLGIRKSRPMKEKLKILRLSNMLEKKRLQNQIQKLKLQRQMDALRKKGVLKQVISAPIRMPQQIYPAYSTPEIIGDIDSAFNADINPAGNDMWGSEGYYGGENYYNEDYYSNEFDNDPLMHLAIKIRTGVSPLLW